LINSPDPPFKTTPERKITGLPRLCISVLMQCYTHTSHYIPTIHYDTLSHAIPRIFP
jgi:hypothetical protein